MFATIESAHAISALPAGSDPSRNAQPLRPPSGRRGAGTAANRATAGDDFIDRLKAGEASACEALARQYGGAMLAVAKRYMRDEDQARDVVQDAFLQAFRAIDGFRAEARLSTWLHRITVTTALMKLRTRRRRREDSIEDMLPNFTEDGHWAEPRRDWDEAPEDALGRRQTRELVRRCIDRLPESYRTVLILRDIDDVDTREAAEALGISETAVKVRLHRARQALRELLAGAMEGGSANRCGRV